MKRMAMVVAAGLVLALSAGCSQPYGRGSGMMMARVTGTVLTAWGGR